MTVRGVTLTAALDDLIALDVEPGEVLLMYGISYDAALRSLRRAGRQDLIEKLRAWRREDTDRLLRALGIRWH